MTPARNLILVDRIPIRWGDMDAMNHVNNTIYFRYMEQTRIAWYEKMFGALSSACDVGMVIVNASCTFIKPLTYPGTVEVSMLLGECSRSSVHSYYEMRIGDILYAEGAAKVVWIDIRRNKAIPLPQSIVDASAGRVDATTGEPQ